MRRWVGVMLAAALAPAMVGAAAPVGQDARALLAQERVGVLSTQSVAMPGYPFGSMTPYALDAEGRPLILISTLAQHTRNLQANPRVSLLVYDTGDANVHDAARLTVLGRAVPAGEEAARARYLNRFPEAARFFAAHDFGLYRIEPEKGYFIGGFGRIFWLEPGELRP